jgi:hypothetical protein
MAATTNDSAKKVALDPTIRPRRVGVSAPHRPGTEAAPHGTAQEGLRIPHIEVKPKEKA